MFQRVVTGPDRLHGLHIFFMKNPADRAVGMKVLEPLFARMARSASGLDLPALWKRLGIEDIGGRIVFHDDAPLAGIRRAIVFSQGGHSRGITGGIRDPP